MRLLDATTNQLEDFVENEIPPYAKLSHTWGTTSDEVSFRGYSGQDTRGAKARM